MNIQIKRASNEHSLVTHSHENCSQKSSSSRMPYIGQTKLRSIKILRNFCIVVVGVRQDYRMIDVFIFRSISIANVNYLISNKN